MDDVAPAGEVMADLGDFWVPNPWRYPPDKNLSAYEPNRVMLNCGGFRFVDISWLSGAGSEADGRGVLVGDFDGDLQPDLIARNKGGGSVRVYLNRFPKVARLVLELEGTRSNRLGIGAHVVAEAGSRRVARQLYPTHNAVCQQSSRLRFGLGDATKVDRLTIHWPSGLVQELRDIATGQLIRVREGEAVYQVVR